MGVQRAGLDLLMWFKGKIDHGADRLYCKTFKFFKKKQLFYTFLTTLKIQYVFSLHVHNIPNCYMVSLLFNYEMICYYKCSFIDIYISMMTLYN